MKQLIGLIVSTLLTSAALAESAAPLRRIEPPFWWAGMAAPTVELMLHGDRIGDPEGTISAVGAELVSVARTENPNYLFVTLAVPTDARTATLTLTRNGENVTSFAYEFRARADGSAARQGFGPKDAIYLVTPDRFANGNPDNDAVPGMIEGVNRKDKDGRHGGDLAGLRQKLDYIAGLGFTMLWSNPVLENNQDRTSYHGYATTDFYRIDPRYGTNEEYRALSQALKARGMGLIMDVIPNHIGNRHWWMQDPPSADWVNRNGQYHATNHRRTAWLDPYASTIDREGFSKGWFSPFMPDLNQGNPHVARYLAQNSVWWIEYAGLAGLRVDTVGYSDRVFTKRWTAAIRQEYPNITIVGEEWSDNPAVVSPWQTDIGMPSVMDFPLNAAVTDAFAGPGGFEGGLAALYKALYNDRLYASPGNLVAFPDNHDMDRLLTTVEGDVEKVRQALAFMAVVPRIPQLFYGTEILAHNDGANDDHGMIRSEMPGGWPNDQVNAFSGLGLSSDQRAMQAFVKRLFGWRKNTAAVHTGQTIHFAPKDGVYVIARVLDGTVVLLALNETGQAVTLDRDHYGEILDNVINGEDVIGETSVNPRGVLVVGAHGFRLLELVVDRP